MLVSDNPIITFMVSLYSVLLMEVLEGLDTLLTHSIQYVIGVLTIIYLIRKIKNAKK